MPPFTIQRRVEFRDTDAAGIVHFSVFFTWMESAEHAALRHLGLSVVMEGEPGKISWPRVSAHCDYQRPLRFEQEVDLSIAVERLGTKSVTYKVEFRHQQALVAVGRMTSVCCRVHAGDQFEAIPIPASLADKLRQLSEGGS